MADSRPSPDSPFFEPIPELEGPAGFDEPAGFEAPPGLEEPPSFETPPSFEVPPAPAPAPSSERPSEIGGRRAVVFTLGQATWATWAAQVAQVEMLGDVVPLPGLPDWILGITHLKGAIVSVIDLAALLGTASAPARKARLLVLRGDDAGVSGLGASPSAVGFVVDRILGVRFAGPARDHTPAPPIVDDLAAFAEGPYEIDGQSLYVTDLAQLFESQLSESPTAPSPV